ncbi:hypothetical protein HDU77_000716, partial [Chytriomyces hyalinus]
MSANVFDAWKLLDSYATMLNGELVEELGIATDESLTTSLNLHALDEMIYIAKFSTTIG